MLLNSTPRKIRSIVVAMSALAMIATAPARAQGVLDKVSFHGSLNAGYGKSDGLGVFGVSKEGTFDYNAIALQFGYKLGSDDRMVVQLLHRSLGTSPLKALMPDLDPVWAFYEKKAAGFTFKFGRNPLPRGIFNEVRFVGTLLPLFREAAYLETLENIDGIVASRSFEVRDWGFDANAMVGEFDIKYFVPSATGPLVGALRGVNSFGTQLWLRTPVQGLRIGTFIDRFDIAVTKENPIASAPQLVRMLSIDGDFTHAFARAEAQTVTAGRGAAKSDYSNWYVQGGLKLSEKFTVLSEFTSVSSLLHPTPLPDLKLNASRDLVGAVNFAPSANVKYKFELHHADGYSFDTSVPTLIAPTRAPFAMSLAPRSKAVYAIISIAVSF
ncbi:MAG: hypothetical protein ABJC26_05620 [Gemmatimonadaceae bacterium]